MSGFKKKDGKWVRERSGYQAHANIDKACDVAESEHLKALCKDLYDMGLHLCALHDMSSAYPKDWYVTPFDWSLMEPLYEKCLEHGVPVEKPRVE